MNKTNFKKYISYVKQTKNIGIEDQYIEKDYFVSLFLSTWQTMRDDGKISHLDALVFKGGTLLARNYLEYPRISEDIDFTYEGSNDLRRLGSKNKREKAILQRIAPIIGEVKLICDGAKFDFEVQRTNQRYIKVRNSRAVYLLNVYYTSLITGEKIPIKIEINFLEDVVYDCVNQTINNIVIQDLFLKSIGYNLVNITLKTYALDEIILEKYRAILTREALKERDVFDLYLIHKRIENVFKCDNKLIRDKIECARLISPDLAQNVDRNCRLLHDGDFGNSEDEIRRLSRVEINEQEYNEFKHQLYKKLKDICVMRK